MAATAKKSSNSRASTNSAKTASSNKTAKGNKSSSNRTSGKKGTSKNASSKKVETKKKANVYMEEISPYGDEMAVVIALVVSVLFALSTFNLCGVFGQYVGSILFGIFGVLAYLIPYLLFLVVIFSVSNKGNYIIQIKIGCCVGIYVVATALIHMFTSSVGEVDNIFSFYVQSATEKSGGGLVGGLIGTLLSNLFGRAGAYVVLFGILIGLFILITEKMLFAGMFEQGKRSRERMIEWRIERQAEREAQREAYREQFLEQREQQLEKRKAKTFTFSQDDKENMLNADKMPIPIEKSIEKQKNAKEIVLKEIPLSDTSSYIESSFGISGKKTKFKVFEADVENDKIEIKDIAPKKREMRTNTNVVTGNFGANKPVVSDLTRNASNLVISRGVEKVLEEMTITREPVYQEELNQKFQHKKENVSENNTILQDNSLEQMSLEELYKKGNVDVKLYKNNTLHLEDENNSEESVLEQKDLEEEFLKEEALLKEEPFEENNLEQMDTGEEEFVISKEWNESVLDLEKENEIEIENRNMLEFHNEMADQFFDEVERQRQEEMLPPFELQMFEEELLEFVEQTNLEKQNHTKENIRINEKMEKEKKVESEPKEVTKKKTTEQSLRENLTEEEMEKLNEVIKETMVVEKLEYKFPPVELLSLPKGNEDAMSDEELKETAMKLQSTLESFGVRVEMKNVSCGPTVTRYELQPAQGVKVSKITALTDDIKLSLAAADIRIEAPIPGKAAVGIEVPNTHNSVVMFRSLVENKEFMEHKSNIAIAVGKDIGGKTILADIAKMPHLLIAGATGSGKSVFINTLIMSILYKAHPDDVKLIMVDPKVVELSVYNGIPHLLIPVVTDPKKASGALNWAVTEMTDRYNKFAELGVRDLKTYNQKVSVVQQENLEDNPKYRKMPQIVIIVDELADLMMVAAGEVEDAICRLAQLARAAGIHLVIATQRPSVNVITGVIKANIPSRVAFAVSSAVDSRTILDGAGAEKLLGNGDMLFFPSGFPKPIRVQGSYVSDDEVSAVVEFLREQNGAVQYSDEVAKKITTAVTSDSGQVGGNDRDDRFVEVAKFIIEKDKASIGSIQRVFKVGYNRAARIMDQLYDAGVVGPEEGTKPRKVIMSMEQFEQYVDEYV